MGTWILLLMVFFTNASGDLEPRGMTAVPDYATERECYAAGIEAMEMALSKTKINFRCVPGPRK